ncbi:VCBS repeat-containing protein [Streptomyces sp. RKAG293]|uniref:FG-GAP repeat domain-containing protein n=1 Tax=Streptomyces sp. RKAG293 TaxID=2893403 RepID=UPI002033BC84|nr:VCBS repeat-containing protein [Streptomyces sp. RKAG293]MCM2417707.1 VCBS repeat-containing protein [Streptomyces sp. RKAG293]
MTTGTAAAVACALLATGVVQFTQPQSAHAQPPANSRTTPSSEAATAVAKAKATGTAVTIAGLTSPTQTVTATPQGTFELSETLLPTRVRKGDAWTPVDTNLQVTPDGSLAPNAVPSGLRLSGGGNAPLATLTSSGRTLVLTWPQQLPKPTITGSTATYAEVLPSVDLTVTASELGGVSEVLVVKSAEAAANPQLAQLSLKATAEGMGLTADPTGNITVKDTQGDAVFHAPAPHMWDSRTVAAAPASARTSKSATSSPAEEGSTIQGPGAHAVTSPVGVSVTSGTINLAPDSEILHSAQTKYPVFIDPSFNPASWAPNKPSYVTAQEGCAGQENWNRTDYDYKTPGVGNNRWSGCIGREHSYFQYGVDSRIWNTAANPVHILKATFKTTEVYSASCGISGTVKVSGSAGVSSATNWTNAPAPATLQDQVSIGPACTEQPATGFSVLNAVTVASNQGWSNLALVMTAADESGDSNTFKRFSNNPTLVVEYDSTPKVTKATSNPATDCAKGGTIGLTRFDLVATLQDPDKGAPIDADFTLRTSSGAIPKDVAGAPLSTYNYNSNDITQPGTVVWKGIPALQSGGYIWTVQANDGKYRSAVVTCKFTVDSTAPLNPTVTSAQFPDTLADGQAPPAARQKGIFVFTPPAGTSDIVKYAYNWGSPPPTIDPPHVHDAAGGTAPTSIELKPMSPLTNTLYFYAIDASGNISFDPLKNTVGSYSFSTAELTAPDVTSDFTADGTADLTAIGGDGNIRLYPGTGSGALSTPSALTTTGDFTQALLATGDFDNSFTQDILARRSDGTLTFYPGDGGGAPLAGETGVPVSLRGTVPFAWADVTQLAAVENTDGRPNDLFTITTDGALWYLRALSTPGAYVAKAQLATTGWAGRTILSAGLVNGYHSLWARDDSTGALIRYDGAENVEPGSTASIPVTVADSGWTKSKLPQLVSAGDANHDGKPDVWAIDASRRQNISSYLSTGDTLNAPTHAQSLRSQRHDYDLDGRSDMAALYSHADGSYELYDFKANADGTLAAPFKGYAATAGSAWAANMKYATGDYNGDGRGDLAILYGYDDGSVRLFTALGNAGGGFSTPAPSWYRPAGSWWLSRMSLQSGDFNGDGRDDLAVWYDYTDGHDTLFTYIATPSGGFSEPFASWTAAAGNWELNQAKFAIGDYNGDGRDDLGILYGYGDMNTVKLHTFLTDTTGAFAYTTTSWTSTTWGSWNQAHIQAGDFNGDGKDDITAWYDYSDGHDSLNTFVSLGTSTGTFQAPYSAWSSTAGNFYYASMPQMVAGDYNGDGRDDLGVMYGYGTGNSRMLTWTAKSDNSGTFNAMTTGAWTSPTGTWTNTDVHFFNTHS